MYKIIGSDGHPYGPATADQLRQWLSENRVNAQTLTQAEGSTQWVPLGTVPEFASDLKPPLTAPPPLASPATLASRASTRIPAGICGILLGAFGVHKFVLGYTGAGLIMLLVTLMTCFLAYPVMHLIGLIEGIIYLAKSDEQFVREYVDTERQWF